MSIIRPEIEIVDHSIESVRYLEHGWPTNLCRWHAHEEFELHLLTQTKGKVFVGDYIGTFDPGGLFLTGPLLPHNWVTDENQHDPVALRDMLVQFNHHGLVRMGQDYPEFRELEDFLNLSRCGIEFIGFDLSQSRQRMIEMRESRGLKRLLLCFEFLRVLSQWPKKKTLSLERVTNKSSTKKYRQIAEVIEFVISNYTSHIPLAKIATMAGMSESSFSRYFQETTGNRFSDFLNQVRIGQACRRLYETGNQISSICYEVGFRNIANFNRQFVKIKGMTPKMYRKHAQESLKQKSDRIAL